MTYYFIPFLKSTLLSPEQGHTVLKCYFFNDFLVALTNFSLQNKKISKHCKSFMTTYCKRNIMDLEQNVEKHYK